MHYDSNKYEGNMQRPVVEWGYVYRRGPLDVYNRIVTGIGRRVSDSEYGEGEDD